ncbi:hypothetical protein [Actinomyces capricornis]|nr:hypothetical protein [Actinomyces capricornis]
MGPVSADGGGGVTDGGGRGGGPARRMLELSHDTTGPRRTT